MVLSMEQWTGSAELTNGMTQHATNVGVFPCVGEEDFLACVSVKSFAKRLRVPA